MPVITPYVPLEITVHLGTPASDSENVTVPFADYIKNVAASEIYPTWEVSALRANILAQISYALNRVYTEYYPSRGYNFNITNTTAYDQQYIYGRSTFENVDRLVDELFSDYIRRIGFIEPLAAKFCNGTTTVCDGMSQWGSEAMALEGSNSVEILQSYYGDVEIVQDAPVKPIESSYPGEPIKFGDFGPVVGRIQIILNRVSQSYPAIPRIDPVDGIFGEETQRSVKAFQEIFGLDIDGIVGRATFNKMTVIYTGILALSELRSKGQTLNANSVQYPEAIGLGSTGHEVEVLQYYLSVIHEFIPGIPGVEINGEFDETTKSAVVAFQQYQGVEATGVVSDSTWDLIYRTVAGIEEALELSGDGLTQYPGTELEYGMED